MYVLLHIHAACHTDIPWGYRNIAQKAGVPADLLFAVALTESGRAASGERLLPWPWALNVSGESFYFHSKHAAVRRARVELIAGNESIDIGVMQVNWRFHAGRFEDLKAAFDPFKNLEVGAAILQECFVRTNDWTNVAACYHVPNNPTLGRRYAKRVTKHLHALGRE